MGVLIIKNCTYLSKFLYKLESLKIQGIAGYVGLCKY